MDDDQPLAALRRAVDLGVNFIATADVYGDGRNERVIVRLRKERVEPILVAIKVGRRLDPHEAAGYMRENLTPLRGAFPAQPGNGHVHHQW